MPLETFRGCRPVHLPRNLWYSETLIVSLMVVWQTQTLRVWTILLWSLLTLTESQAHFYLLSYLGYQEVPGGSDIATSISWPTGPAVQWMGLRIKCCSGLVVPGIILVTPECQVVLEALRAEAGVVWGYPRLYLLMLGEPCSARNQPLWVTSGDSQPIRLAVG